MGSETRTTHTKKSMSSNRKKKERKKESIRGTSGKGKLINTRSNKSRRKNTNNETGGDKTQAKGRPSIESHNTDTIEHSKTKIILSTSK